MKKIVLLIIFLAFTSLLFPTVVIKGHTNDVSGTVVLHIYANTISGQGVMAQARYNGPSYTYISFIAGSWVENGTGGEFGSYTNFDVTISGLPTSGSADFEAAKCDYGTTNNGFEYTGFVYTVSDMLPVELTSFSASIKNRSVNLVWHTATEINNYGFEIQKSIRNEELGIRNWNKVGFVNGSGNSSSPKDYSYTDKTAATGKYIYRLKQIDNDGQYEYSKEVEVDLGKPTTFALNQNYPNPFNPSTVISYQLPANSYVTLKVYNAIGTEVAALVNEYKEAGSYNYEFGSASGGRNYELTSGIYFYTLRAGSFVQTKKMVLLK
ncbi:MAG: T9SS type A sorting domain-containing protein [Ignavibacteria bacterium]|nr:T9SS type A sorting domain-containing protein [Ignavibacteria bacterium]